MVATAATSAFFPVAPLLPDSGSKRSSNNLNTTKLVNKGINQKHLKVQTNAHSPPKINGTSNVSLSSTKEGGVKNEDETHYSGSHASRTFINQLPDWSMLLAAVTTVFLAAEKQWMMLDTKPKRPDMDPFGIGRIVEDGRFFRQNFVIRSYEIGADRTASIETVMNHLQETAINHAKTAGFLGDGFGATPEMCKRSLFWAVSRMQVLVDRYPTWGDVVQVDTWSTPSGKNGTRRDWLVRDYNTGEVLMRASSMYVMMNKLTRRLSKIPDEVRTEISSHYADLPPVIDEDVRKLTKLDDNTAEYIRTGLTPRWGDLDVNQHVNNVKYIAWLLESTPSTIMETHELSGITLEYRKECSKDNVVESLSTVSKADPGVLVDSGDIECQHLLRLEGGAEVVRGRTEWRPKNAKSFGNLGTVPEETT